MVPLFKAMFFELALWDALLARALMGVRFCPVYSIGAKTAS